MSNITTADKNLLLKDIKIYLDEEWNSLKKHVHEVDLLKQKKVGVGKNNMLMHI